MRNAYKILIGKPEGKRLTTRSIQEDIRCGLDAFGSGSGLVVAFCEYSNEISQSTKGREFPDQLSDN
jgi:hypothetical protein